MPILTNPAHATPFVFEPELTDVIKKIHQQCIDIFVHLPNIYTQKPETAFFVDHIKPYYRLYDVDKPLMQVVYLTDSPYFQSLAVELEKYGLHAAIKFFQSDPTDVRFKDVEHLFFCHRHHYTSSVASLIFPIAGCDSNTITSWPEYEDVDGYVPDDPTTGVYWSEYYWQTYQKHDPTYKLPDSLAKCRYSLTDRPALWNVKQWHEAINHGTQHRVIANINFKSATQTWEDSIDVVREMI
jgi:hypothetical protein